MPPTAAIKLENNDNHRKRNPRRLRAFHPSRSHACEHHASRIKRNIRFNNQKVKVMEQKTNIERDIDRDEIKRIWQQLAIGTVLALVGLVFMGIGEAICRWIEGL